MLGELIKEAARGCLREENPAEVVFGTVTAAEPLAVKVEDRLLVQGERLLLPGHLKKRVETLTFGKESREIVFCPGLEAGDKVILVRVGGYFLVAGAVTVDSWQWTIDNYGVSCAFAQETIKMESDVDA